jgi:Cu-processing system permease protein
MIFYTIFLLIASFSVFNLEDTSSKGILSMLSIMLLIVPLVSIIFSTIYVYNSTEFIELLLSQPIKRKTVWLSLFGGLAGSLSLAFIFGAGIITFIFEPSFKGLLLVLLGVFLSVIFSSIAMLAAVSTRDKAKGMGSSILLWLYFSVLFDGLFLFAIFQFSDYPIEKYMVGLSMLNPIDLSRILLLMQFDVSALMGYSGAIFRDYFGTTLGMIISTCAMILWIIAPLYFSLRKFKSKDL